MSVNDLELYIALRIRKWELAMQWRFFCPNEPKLPDKIICEADFIMALKMLTPAVHVEVSNDPSCVTDVYIYLHRVHFDCISVRAWIEYVFKYYITPRSFIVANFTPCFVPITDEDGDAFLRHMGYDKFFKSI